MQPGDILSLQSGSIATVGAIWLELLDAPTKVYNFEVEDFHTYYVGVDAVLVHNSCGVVPTNELTPTHGLTRNRRQMRGFINDIKTNGIQDSIKYVNYQDTKYVVDGHHRLAAARALKISNVPAKEVSLPYAGYKTVADLFW